MRQQAALPFNKKKKKKKKPRARARTRFICHDITKVQV